MNIRHKVAIAKNKINRVREQAHLKNPIRVRKEKQHNERIKKLQTEDPFAYEKLMAEFSFMAQILDRYERPQTQHIGTITYQK